MPLYDVTHSVHYWDDATMKRLILWFEAPRTVPHLIRELEGPQDARLSTLLQQLEEFCTLTPQNEDTRLRVSLSMQALFAEGIMGSIIDLAESDKRYVPSTHPTRNLEVRIPSFIFSVKPVPNQSCISSDPSPRFDRAGTSIA